MLDMLKQLCINISLVEALEQMLNYVKAMKEFLPKKRRLGEFETIALTTECSLSFQNKLLLKLKDPERYTTPCNIGESYYGKVLCGLGSSINLMLASLFRRLGVLRPDRLLLHSNWHIDLWHTEKERSGMCWYVLINSYFLLTLFF